MNDLLVAIQKQRMAVNAAALAVGAIASGGPDNALAELEKLKDLILEYKRQKDE